VRTLAAQNIKGRLQNEMLSSVLKFLTRHAQGEDEFLDSIVTEMKHFDLFQANISCENVGRR
jgi:hypothetical protein